MKRLLPALLLLLTVLGGAWWYNHVQELREARSWHPLPGGGEARILTITHGTVHEYRNPPPPLTQRIAEAYRARSLASFRLPPPTVWQGADLGPRPSLGVRLKYRGATDLQTPSRAELILPSGQAFSSGLTTKIVVSASPVDKVLGSVTVFGHMPVRPKTLRYAWEEGSKQVVFEFDNPTHRADLPAWKSAPLPQTQQWGDLAVTLDTVKIERAPLPLGLDFPVGWVARPACSIKFKGQPADSWFSVSYRYEDPSGQLTSRCGLFDEPVWKIHCTVHRTDRYPYNDDEIFWLGTATPEAPAEQTMRLFSLDLNSLPRGVHLAGVFGPGEYWYQQDAIVGTAPVTRTSPMIDLQAHAKIGVALEKSAVVAFSSTPLIFRDTDDHPVPLKLLEESPHAITGVGKVRIYELPATPVRIGTVESKAAEFEFLIPAPEKPAATR